MTSYQQAGVDLEGAERHVRSIAEVVTAGWSGEVVGDFGGFAAGVRLPSGMRDPVLTMTTDGVGTKLELARRSGRWDGVGFDLVAMCVDDLAAVGARPLGFVDYLSVGSLQADRDRAIVASIASACAEAGCPLLGGETAEHPGVMDEDAVDLAGAALGVVEATELLHRTRVTPGDLVVGLASPNLRSNGFSLVRTLLGDRVDDHLPTLLEPSVIYSPAVIAATTTGAVHSAAHITGGGIVSNLSRALPAEMGARLDTTAWQRPQVFQLIADQGVTEEEMRRVFNLGIGFCLVVDPAGLSAVLAATAGHSPVVLGEVSTEPGVVLA